MRKQERALEAGNELVVVIFGVNHDGCDQRGAYSHREPEHTDRRIQRTACDVSKRDGDVVAKHGAAV